jgi:hypothetical protein
MIIQKKNVYYVGGKKNTVYMNTCGALRLKI